MGDGVVLIVAVGDKVHQKGQRILQSGDVVEQVVNHENPASFFVSDSLTRRTRMAHGHILTTPYLLMVESSLMVGVTLFQILH